MSVREQWRVVLLAILLLASGVLVFVPGAVGSTDGATNLRYGLQLEGGAQIRAPVVGATAEGVNVTTDNQLAIETAVAERLGLEIIDVQARPPQDTVEVFKAVNHTALREALVAAGYEPTTIRDGVTRPTRQAIVEVLGRKVNTAGLAGGQVSIARTPGGEHFIVVTAPGRNISAIEELVENRGLVRMVASRPDPDGSGTIREVVIQQNAIEDISQIQRQRGVPVVPVTLSKQGAKRFSAAMLRLDFVEQALQGGSGTTCNYQQSPNSSYCLLTVLNDRVVYSSSLGDGLARDMKAGDFNKTRQFVIQAANASQARELRLDLQTGALPARLNVSAGTETFITGTRAQEFKRSAVLTALMAIVAVSAVVFARYGRIGVALPMVLTALSEVAILLGFAAAVRLPLGLAHIAGFLAVIGTGVDDLVIIADEVMTEEVASSRVFRSRFRKALWVIGAAAATTIIAMSPLTVLSLGDLTGFAIVTILGVLVGVLVTRPAYGDILRALLTDR
ncbi:MAG: preprotein translocase subunit SecD [Halobacteriaceae archaeon]